MSKRLNVARLQEELQTRWLGRNVFFSREVGSTNEWAKELARLGACEGTVVLAETQTAGHGRLGREWHSPVGGLWFSVILRPQFKPAESARLVFAAGLAVAETLREQYGLKVETNWPNDVLVDGRKICGVLTEMNSVGGKVNFVVVGVGVNVNFDVGKVFPEELQETATSLKKECGEQVSLDELLRVLLVKLEKTYELFTTGGFLPVLAEWRKYARFLGSQVEVSTDDGRLQGVALDVDEEGALLLKQENRLVKRAFFGDMSTEKQ
jgi:biotin-[acetyl-CoA-carboxylase] ligase BirA-like protein